MRKLKIFVIMLVLFSSIRQLLCIFRDVGCNTAGEVCGALLVSCCTPLLKE